MGGHGIPDSLVESLDSLLPDSLMISTSHARWGRRSGSFIDVRFDRPQLVRIDVSLDLRVPCLTLISELTLLANRQQWLAIMTDGRLFRPTVRRFLGRFSSPRPCGGSGGAPEAFLRRHSARRINPAMICE